MNLTYTSLRKEAEEHRKAEKYLEAVERYRLLLENFPSECTEWDYWGLAHSLRKLKEYSLCLDICRLGYKKHNSFERLNTVYAWAIYYTELDKENTTDAVFFKAADGILKLCKQENKYSPYTLTVFKVLKYLKDKPSYPAERILHYLSFLEPSLLSQEPNAFTDSEGKKRELPSELEDYYAHYTKALFEKGQYEDCVAGCKEALAQFQKFHYDNDVWFSRRIALAAKKTGQPEVALNDLLKIVGKRKEWFIQHEIAQLYFELGEPELTLSYALESALNFGDMDKKGKVLELLYNLLNAQGHAQEALDHIKLKHKASVEAGHQVKANEIQLLESQGVVVEQLPPAKTLEKNLRTFWMKLLDDFKPTLKGTINKILDTGQAGFISKNKKESYFFQIKSFRGDKKLCVVGQQVSFQLEEGFDKKKNQPTQVAVNVRPLEKSVNNMGVSN